jgi:membrane-bound lytic murein transglycosylase F
VYRNEAMGFDYELAREFADHLNVRLEIVPRGSWPDMCDALERGEGDLIAGVEMTPARATRAAFSNSYMEVQQHLVSNRGRVPLASLAELNGRTVDLPGGSAHLMFLEELQRRGLQVTVRTHDHLSEGSLIPLVARGEIDCTIAASNVAFLSRRYYPTTAVHSLGEEAFISMGWAVPRPDQALLDRVNAFFAAITAGGRFDEIYEKYHPNIDAFDPIDLKAFHDSVRVRLPRFRPIIRDAARRNGLDWCLIASQIYQESRLDPLASGQNGAQGLMQILPATARSLKVTDPFDPVASIRAGTAYLKSLYDLYEGLDETERVLTALAAYNAGPGHVNDARRLAARMGLDPGRWESLARALPLLRLRPYYQDAEQGFCRGDITVAYVRQIMTYYDILKRQELDTAVAALGVSGRARVD